MSQIRYFVALPEAEKLKADPFKADPESHLNYSQSRFYPVILFLSCLFQSIRDVTFFLRDR